jgi:hypothetical protein
MKPFLIILFLPLLFSCNHKINDWQKVETIDDNLCIACKTEYATNHQGEHTLTDCFAFVDDDTLHIRFPAGLPAYWLGVELKVTDGMFTAEVSGILFIPNVELTHQIKQQQLYVNEQHYTIGDTLRGYVELVFEERDKTHNQANEFYFKGCINKIVRDKHYHAFEDDIAIMSHHLDYAINEFGEPLDEDLFTTCCLPEFRIELLNIFPASDSIYIRELTWNTSDDAQISDGGIYRLTVWYAQQDSLWMPVHFLRWNTHMQF